MTLHPIHRTSPKKAHSLITIMLCSHLRKWIVILLISCGIHTPYSDFPNYLKNIFSVLMILGSICFTSSFVSSLSFKLDVSSRGEFFNHTLFMFGAEPFCVVHVVLCVVGCLAGSLPCTHLITQVSRHCRVPPPWEPLTSGCTWFSLSMFNKNAS